MTEIIAGKRQSGRSTALIRKSAETGIYILVANRKRAEHLALLARDLGYNIPFPVTLQDYLRCRFAGSCIRREGIFIDDVDDVVEELFNPIEIKAVTFLYDAESRAGEWIKKDGFLVCSKCDATKPIAFSTALKITYYKCNYCPKCGAKMKDGE